MTQADHDRQVDYIEFGLPERPAVCYCGDDPRAKRAVARYLEPFALLVAELAYKQRRRPEVGVRFLRPRRQRGKKRD